MPYSMCNEKSGQTTDNVKTIALNVNKETFISQEKLNGKFSGISL